LTCINALPGKLRQNPDHLANIRGVSMLTTSEIAAIVIIWVLLAIGVFFGLRAALRRRRAKRR